MPRNLKDGEIIYVRYLKHGHPVPDGWVLADKLERCHHGFFAVIIRKKEK